MLYFIIAFLLSVITIPIVIKLKIMDKPNYRKIHINPIPKAGGLGIFIPLIFIQTWIVFTSTNIITKELYIILLSSVLLLIVGIIDDKYELKSMQKLYLQIIVAIIIVSGGVSFNLFDNPFLNYLLTVIWLVGIINAFNLIDGLDGLAAGIGLITTVGYYVVLPNHSSVLTQFLILPIIGSLVGFLLFNFRPAKIFMGDTGSLPLGNTLALLGVYAVNYEERVTGLFIPCLLLLLPIFDTMLSIVRRKINGKPIFAPDRSHFYNLLMDKKHISHRNVVLIVYFVNVLLVFLTVRYKFMNDSIRILTILIVLGMSIAVSYKLGFLQVDEENKEKKTKKC